MCPHSKKRAAYGDRCFQVARPEHQVGERGSRQDQSEGDARNHAVADRRGALAKLTLNTTTNDWTAEMIASRFSHGDLRFL